MKPRVKRRERVNRETSYPSLSISTFPSSVSPWSLFSVFPSPTVFLSFFEVHPVYRIFSKGSNCTYPKTSSKSILSKFSSPFYALCIDS